MAKTLVKQCCYQYSFCVIIFGLGGWETNSSLQLHDLSLVNTDTES